MGAKWRVAQFLELLWWKRYLRQKSPAEYLAWKRNYWKHFFETLTPHLKIRETDFIIELGCGPAGCFTWFTKNKIIAIDPLIESYDAQLKHFSKADYPNTLFVASTIEDFLPEQKADVVLCINAINHVDDIAKAMNNLCNAVQPGGKLVLSIDAHKYGWMKWLFKLIPADALHPHQCTLNEYVELLQSASFEVETVLMMKKGVVFDYWVVVAKIR